MWNTLIVDPMTNILLLIYSVIGNFGFSIIIFTVLIRLITHPLTAQQLKSSSALQEMQKSKAWQDMQTKYKDDKERLSQEQMKMYQEAGVNPFGSCLPTLIQFPVIIGLYQAIIAALATTPLQMVTFIRHIWPSLSNIVNVSALVPLNNSFLGLDLSISEQLGGLTLPFAPAFGLPLISIFVFITSYMQSKMLGTQSTGSGDQQNAMMSQFTLIMPFFIAYLSYTYASGLALYFLATNLFSIIQYAFLGKLDWKNLIPKFLQPQTVPPVSGKIKKTNKK